MITLFLGDQEVAGYAKDLARRLEQMGESFPMAWCPIGKSGDKMSRAVAVELSAAHRDKHHRLTSKLFLTETKQENKAHNAFIVELIMLPTAQPTQISCLSDKTKAVLMDVLGVSKLEDVLYKDFQDISVSCDVNRKQAVLYSDRNRGSVRLNAGRYYTANEFQERVQQAKFIPLP